MKLGRVVDGLRIVREGLKPGDVIVVNGAQRVHPGVTVTPQRVTMGGDAPSRRAALRRRALRRRACRSAAMNISSFFIERPIFASVLAILITVAGLLAIPSLPISEYPEIVPPTVVVSGQYPGASPKTIAETVITPLEQQINGVENAIYTNSTATPDGSFSITVTFRLGTNLDIAQVQTQNRVSQAEPRLPDVVRQVGLVTQKRSPDLTMVVFLKSADGRYDSLYLRNYAVIQIRDVLARLQGTGDVEVFGSGDYAMRLWLDPGKIAARSMDVDEVLAAVREQNVQVAAGQIGGQPSLPGHAVPIHRQCAGPAADRAGIRQHRHQERCERRDDLFARRRAARARSGNLRAAQHAGRGTGGSDSCVPAARARTRSSCPTSVRATMKELAKNFPQGVSYEIDYDPTVFVRSSIEAVVHTLFEAVAAGRAGGGRVSADLARERHSAGRRARGDHRHPGGAACLPDSRSIP